MEYSKSYLNEQLKKYFGFDRFKGLQEEIVTSVLNGEDAFVLMPTGGGKSLCYQLPALIMDGTAIVVSPLIALMKNQVDAMRSISKNDAVAHVLNSSLVKKEIQQVKSDVSNGLTKLLYVAPESLNKEEYNDFLAKEANISFIAIDEAHCISEWGHDFRPEYRNLQLIMARIKKDIPIIALTATATEKVQSDIVKNLKRSNVKRYKASFNRPNLFYEVRPKTSSINSDIIKFIKQNEGKSGIIYCLSRKTVDEIAQTLQINGISALPYHGGIDTKNRSKHQDMFLKEDIKVIVATIAFGMGIDKPDVRYVIHYDVPKSLESYYQETGRAGRDGGEGHCLAFYSYSDIEKLEKFMQGKPIAEQEIQSALLQEVSSYAETSMSRRKFLLHYFNEEFDEINGEGADMDDNSRNPKPKKEAMEDAKLVFRVIKETGEMYLMKDIVAIIVGKINTILKSRKLDSEDFFGIGASKGERYWAALLRQLVVRDYLEKHLETYGTLRLKPTAHEFMKNPTSFMMIQERSMEEQDSTTLLQQSGSAVMDEVLLKLLKDLRKSIGDKHGIAPYLIFQEPSLEDMVVRYPITIDELAKIHGVGEGKAKRYGQEFVKLIAKYVEENEIERDLDMVVKTTGTRSELKLYVIQSVDRKLDIKDIAKSKGIETSELIKEMESIVYSGTKLNISYYVDEIIDEDAQQELYDYFINAESDNIDLALKEFGEDYDENELRLYRLKFISEVAN